MQVTSDPKDQELDGGPGTDEEQGLEAGPRNDQAGTLAGPLVLADMKSIRKVMPYLAKA